jgi:hypothetical protein
LNIPKFWGDETEYTENFLHENYIPPTSQKKFRGVAPRPLCSCANASNELCLNQLHDLMHTLNCVCSIYGSMKNAHKKLKNMMTVYMFDYLHFIGMLITAFHGICHPCLHDFMVTNCSHMFIVILWYSPLGCDVKRNIVVFSTWLWCQTYCSIPHLAVMSNVILWYSPLGCDVKCNIAVSLLDWITMPLHQPYYKFSHLTDLSYGLMDWIIYIAVCYIYHGIWIQVLHLFTYTYYIWQWVVNTQVTSLLWRDL